MRFKGACGIVTGASRGLGRNIAIAFAKEGAFVGIGYLHSEKEAQKTLEEIKSNGGNGVLLQVDITDLENVDTCFRKFVSDYNKIDFLVNNAGIVDDKPMVLMSKDNWSSVINTNLTGAFNCSKAVVKSMLSQRNGSIINISSVAGIAASPGQVNYAASKGGLIAMTKTMASELASFGIRVNAVIPGLITKGMTEKMDRRIADSYRKRIPLERFAEPEEVSNAVIFLASSDASYIIGQTLIVDGGLTL
jgi:3-oxoacyl-[acyl-carrier protein] reductase